MPQAGFFFFILIFVYFVAVLIILPFRSNRSLRLLCVDIWSFGCVLSESWVIDTILVCRQPFQLEMLEVFGEQMLILGRLWSWIFNTLTKVLGTSTRVYSPRTLRTLLSNSSPRPVLLGGLVKSRGDQESPTTQAAFLALHLHLQRLRLCLCWLLDIHWEDCKYLFHKMFALIALHRWGAFECSDLWFIILMFASIVSKSPRTRQRFSSARRVEVAAVRRVGACKTCRSRKVRVSYCCLLLCGDIPLTVSSASILTIVASAICVRYLLSKTQGD